MNKFLAVGISQNKPMNATIIIIVKFGAWGLPADQASPREKRGLDSTSIYHELKRNNLTIVKI